MREGTGEVGRERECGGGERKKKEKMGKSREKTRTRISGEKGQVERRD